MNPTIKSYLDWPEEICRRDSQPGRWTHPGSNICLDFHGNPDKAQLVVFSDGNHNMALKECLNLFKQQNTDLSEIFYATTPPGPIVNMLKRGGLQMGNLVIEVSPDVFISPPDILDKLVEKGFMSDHAPFFQNQGNVLLVKKGNPKNILTIADINQLEVRLFISNPETEKASYTIYSKTLLVTASGQDSDPEFLYNKITQGQVLFGESIHHREAPQAVADGSADVAIVFYHLALHYLRIFPDLFEAIPLGGSIKKPKPLPGNITAKTNMGLVGDGGEWGAKLLSFLNSKQAMIIYRHHGLRPI